MIVYTFYFFFLLITILVQADNVIKKEIKKKDPFNLLPHYFFFCPRPIRTDYHLYYRIMDKTIPATDWTKVQFGKKRNLGTSIWHSTKRQKKFLSSFVQIVYRHYKGKNVTRFGHIYMLVLNHLRQIAATPGRQIQFRITANQVFNEDSKEKEYYTSTIHNS